MSTLSFIFATPKRVMPKTSPCCENELAPLVMYDVKETSLVRHDIPKKHDVAGIYAHAMRRHGVLNLINDGSSRRFNA
jgi:hypothetical protein